MKIVPAFLLLAAACGAAAPQGDPLKSPACGQALAALEAGRAAGQAAALRDRAAQACLGAAPAPGRPGRVLQAPIVVPPPVIAPPPEPAPIAAPPRLPPPPVAIDRPAAPATCDAGGCWVQDGAGLRHVAPNLAGPNGLCSQQGAVVYCP